MRVSRKDVVVVVVDVGIGISDGAIDDGDDGDDGDGCIRGFLFIF